MHALAGFVVWIASGEAEAACNTSPDVVINEFLPDPDGTDANAEWVELFNRGTEPIDLEGWQIEAGNDPTHIRVLFPLPPLTLLAPGGWLVVAGALAPLTGVSDVVRLEAPFDMGNAGSNSDAVRLVDCAGAVRDVVAYGLNNDGGVFLDEEEEEIVAEKLAPKPASDKSISRAKDGEDTNNGAADFVLSSAPTPGASNGVAGGSCLPGPGGVLINEVFANPGADTNPAGASDSGYEWIELYVPGDHEVDVSGWQIHQAGAPADWGGRVKFTFPAGSMLPAGSHAVIADPDITFADGLLVFRVSEVTTLSLGNAEDAVRLVDCAGAPIDTVLYGGSNPDGFVDGAGLTVPDEQVGPEVLEDASLARRSDGYNEGSDAEDFLSVQAPTPGRANADLECESAGGTVFINEFLADPEGTDSTARSEWVELYNAARIDIDLTGWVVAKATSRSEGQVAITPLYTFGSDAVILSGGFLRVGGVAADGVEHFTDPFDLGSGSGGDLVLLLDCNGRRTDSILYGGDNDDLLDEDDGYIPDQGAEDPSEDQCVARITDGLDTNLSEADAVTTNFCTPGSTNVRVGGGGGGGDDDPVGGCAGAASGPRAVQPRDGSCSTSGAPAGWCLVLMAFIRRRR